jgi:carbamoyltransferase
VSIRILGISAFYHDAAAALVDDGAIVGAAQEERFTRVKGDDSFPHHAIGWCLDRAGIDIDDVEHVVFYEHPVVKFERLVESYLTVVPRGLWNFLRAMPQWLTRKLWLEREIARELGIDRRIWLTSHHLSHAASAFFPSPFDEAAILTIDGVGEWSTATWGIGHGNHIELCEEMRFPNSLGLLYSAFTYYCGFRINSGEYKLMGLAPYGEPRYTGVILDKLVRLGDDGTVLLNQRYFNYVTGLTMTNGRFHRLFGGPPRQPEGPITQREMDLAASIQAVINEAILRMGRHVHARTGLDRLAMAGGVALNCVAAGRLSVEGPFRSIWTQPAAGDAGGALGAALWFWHHQLGRPRTAASPDAMEGAFLGPEIPPTSNDDDAMLCRLGAVWESLSDEQLQNRIAQAVAAGKVVAVARGRMEFGPRALGARSILGDARSPTMQSHMNHKVKFRESFRPFAPMVLEEDAHDYFALRQESPYMLLVYPVHDKRRRPVETAGRFGMERLQTPRSDLPAVTHVDWSARLQTVDRARNPFMHGLLERFRDLTGCSVMINTSFNVRGEPIVNTVEDAFRCFMATEIDCLVIGNRFLERERQKNRPLNAHERARWLRRFPLD